MKHIKTTNWANRNIKQEPKNFVRVTVKRWLKQNVHRFLNRPRITGKKKHGFDLKFSGITKQLVVNIHHGWAFEIWVSDDQNNCWDILTEFDLAVEQDDAGRYYCELCVEEHREFYSSAREIWEKHSLEPLLEWANENLRPNRWLCLFGQPADSTWARLVDEDKLPVPGESGSFYAACPLVVKR